MASASRLQPERHVPAANPGGLGSKTAAFGTLKNGKLVLGVLVAITVGVFFLYTIKFQISAPGAPDPSPLVRAGNYLRSLTQKLHRSFAGDEEKTEIANRSFSLTEMVGFEHSELFRRFVESQRVNYPGVAEYLTSVKAYLLNFRSPMIRETPSQYSWPETLEQQQQRRESGSNESDVTVKRIAWYNVPSFLGNASSDALFGHCPVKDCELSYRYKSHATVDAVLFHDLPGKAPPPRDHQGQVYVFHMMESPANTGSGYLNTPWNSAVNWTWTYRVDADVFTPVGYLKRSQSVPSHSQLLQLMQHKTKKVAWLVSNCNTRSRRREYVQKLQKVVPVDIYGGCGTKKCSRQDSKCISMLNDYFFYLSFENSMCQDYVTEKYYKTFNKGVNVLSVVRGGANYSRFFPEGTFIDADWFTGPEQLGSYLLELSKNPARYVDMMWRRAHFLYHEHGIVDAHCQLCYKLHHLDQFSKTYKDMFEWFHKRRCADPKPFR